MRTYGRITLGYDDGGVPIKQWVMVETAPDGSNNELMLTSLAQALLLMINESPFYADWGIPARESVMQQVAPDFYVALTQQRFAPQFASLIVARTEDPIPTYNINVTTKLGTRLLVSFPIPT